VARNEKKSESLDVRLPYSVKQRFMAQAKARGETASEAVRNFIEAYLDASAAGELPIPKRSFVTMVKPHAKKIAGMAGAAIGGAFILTLLPTAAAAEAVFELFDENTDGVLTEGEIAPNDTPLIQILDRDGSGGVSIDEFQMPFRAVEVSEKHTQSDPERILEVTFIDFEIADETTHLRISRTASNLPADATEAEREDALRSLLQKIPALGDMAGEVTLPPVLPEQPL